MVVFTCQKCNSTLKKNAVEKHFKCRPFLLTCIDCLKDFRGKEYEEHKTCISEAQKYGGRNFVAKPQGVKQEQWVEQVAKVLTNLCTNSRYKIICKAIMSSANIPRLRAKFNNFIKCAHPRLYDEVIVNEIFDHLEAEKDSSKYRASGNNTTHFSSKTEEKCDSVSSLEKSETNEKTKEKDEKKNFYIKMKKQAISQKKILASLSDDQKTNIDCWFNIQKPNKSIDGEQNSLLVDENINNDSSTLSRKQKKKLKKQKNYEAEINEIENYKPEELNENGDLNSKNKNRESNITESNLVNNGKRKHEDEVKEDDPEKKMKTSLNDTLEIEEIPMDPGKKFKWGNAIKEVLQSNSDKVLSLKKLRKKVMNEYRRQKGDDVPYDKLLGIFNKKLNKTVGVKVLKDRVTLVGNDNHSS